MILWLKALHIIFVVCWFSGIFYLPRLFVNSAMAEHEETKAQLAIMQRKLYRFMTVLAILAVLFGLALIATNVSYYLSQTWMQLKFIFVATLIIYHIICGRYVRAFEQDGINKTHRFFRWFNEAPVLILTAIVLLVVLKPF